MTSETANGNMNPELRANSACWNGRKNHFLPASLRATRPQRHEGREDDLLVHGFRGQNLFHSIATLRGAAIIVFPSFPVRECVDSRDCELSLEGVNEKAFRSIDSAHIRLGVCRNLHAPNLRLVVDGHRDAVFSEVSIGSIFGHPGCNSGASILPPRPLDAQV